MWRPSLSHILIALAAVLAFVFNFLAVQDRSDTILVAVADGRIQAGSRVDASDIRFVEIPASFGGLGGLVDQASWEEMSGWVALRPVDDGAVLAADVFGPPSAGDGMRSMSVPVPIEHAVGGLIEVGDTVDVLSVSEAGPAFVATAVTVVGVAPERGSGIGGSGGFYVVLAVDADQALRLAMAIDTGSIELIRSTGASPISEGTG